MWQSFHWSFMHVSIAANQPNMSPCFDGCHHQTWHGDNAHAAVVCEVMDAGRVLHCDETFNFDLRQVCFWWASGWVIPWHFAFTHNTENVECKLFSWACIWLQKQQNPAAVVWLGSILDQSLLASCKFHNSGHSSSGEFFTCMRCLITYHVNMNLAFSCHPVGYDTSAFICIPVAGKSSGILLSMWILTWVDTKLNTILRLSSCLMKIKTCWILKKVPNQVAYVPAHCEILHTGLLVSTLPVPLPLSMLCQKWFIVL